LWRNLNFTRHQIILLLAYTLRWRDSYQTTSPNLNRGPKMPSDHGDFLVELQALCQAIAQGQYDGLDSLFALTGSDEVPEDIRDLAEAFGSMVVQIEAREFRLGGTLQELKETNRKLEEAQKRLASENVTLRTEVNRLKIEIDQTRKDAAVAEIADTEYFQTLQTRARTMRARNRSRDHSNGAD
jgi:septal ring factor EnvC (AmiA/AmiB activator)